MIALLITILVLLFILIMLFWVKIEIEIKYHTELEISVLFLGGKIKYPVVPLRKTKQKKKSGKKEMPVQKKEQALRRDKVRFSVFYNLFLELAEDIKRLLRVKKFMLHVDFGFDDAALTGMTSGLAWAAIYNLLGVFGIVFTFEQPDIVISPHFNQNMLQVEFHSIILVKQAHIIVILYKAYKVYQAYRKE